jgi:hypothetical protein
MTEPATRIRTLHEAAGWVAAFDQAQDDWPEDRRFDRPTVRRLAEGLRAMADSAETRSEPEVKEAVLLDPRDDGTKGYYGPRVELLLMDDGSVRWRYDADD